MPRIFKALALAAILLTPALALSRGPDGANDTDKAAQSEAQKTKTASAELETLKNAARAQGEISPQTQKALQEAKGGFGLGGQPPQAPTAPKPGSGKAIYGDIIIHK